MNYLKTFLNEYAPSIIHSVITVLLSYITISVKKIYQKEKDQKLKKDIIETVCQGINNLYPNLNYTDKMNKIINNCKQILSEKGITMNDLELQMFIASHKLEN